VEGQRAAYSVADAAGGASLLGDKLCAEHLGCDVLDGRLAGDSARARVNGVSGAVRASDALADNVHTALKAVVELALAAAAGEHLSLDHDGRVGWGGGVSARRVGHVGTGHARNCL
jgi:hypothetical protein